MISHWLYLLQHTLNRFWVYSDIDYILAPPPLCPPTPGLGPPHCLKKIGTSCCLHAPISPVTHSFCTGRYPAPLSPPMIAQCTPDKSGFVIGPSSGSKMTNRTWHRTWRKSPNLDSCCSDSTLVPIQICTGISLHLKYCANRSLNSAIRRGRLVNT